MPSTLITSWILIGTTVIVIQLLLWLLFRRQIRGLWIEEGHRFSTPKRLRLISILYPILALGTYGYLSWILW